MSVYKSIDENLYLNDTLQHHGVLGMKWGVRKAQEKGTDYNYKSLQSRAQEKKVELMTKMMIENAKKKSTNGDLYIQPSNKYLQAIKDNQIYKIRDQNRQAYARTSSVGNSILRTMLLGPVLNLNYERLRSSGKSIVESALLTPVPVVAAVSEYKNAALEYDRRRYQ